MSAFETATKFFHACESLEGWEGCQQYATADATFVGQCEPLVDITSAEGYCEWMKGFGTVTAKGCSYDLHTAAWDEASNTATFFATFHGTHVGDGGPVPPTNQSTASHYVYVIAMNDEGKVAGLTKIWNAPWAMRELGWT